jgi:hypothetical protein
MEGSKEELQQHSIFLQASTLGQVEDMPLTENHGNIYSKASSMDTSNSSLMQLELSSFFEIYIE